MSEIRPDGPAPAGPGADRQGRHERSLIGLALVLGLIIAAGGAWIVTGRLLDASSGGLGAGLRRAWLARQADALQPPLDGVGPETTFVVGQGEPLASVAERLQAEGLIRDAAAFRLLARVRGLDTQIQAGSHALNGGMSAEAVLAELLSAQGESITVVLPEGRRLEEVLAQLSEVGLGSVASLTEAAAALRASDLPDGLAWVPADSEGRLSLEGFLFPDTYQFDPSAGGREVLGVLLANFAARWPADGEARASALGLSPYEALTLASIVEREAALASERPRIARVFHNRLAEAPFILNADPTIQYALGLQPESGAWWRRPLSSDDLRVDSPYNSYDRGGLPPGPICSPGLASIEAVLSPEPGAWRYFVADDAACDGSHVFAETLEAHAANIARVQGGDCGS